ncbi:MAG: hypothetical protein LWY06_08410 [Firmicutes bacterium]|nr:hypothetical protein [Bacillota bacterium]
MSRNGIAAVLLALFLCLCCRNSWCADNMNFKLKPITQEQTQTAKPDKIVVTVGANIIKGDSLKSGGRKYLDTDLVVAVLKALNVNASFDLSVMALAMEKPQTAAKLPVSEPNGNLTVVIGGTILKTDSCVADQKAYINYRFVENLLKGMGYEVKFDSASNFITIADKTEPVAEPAVASASDPEQPTPATASVPPPPVKNIEPAQPAGKEKQSEDIQAIASYMNALKKIFDDNAPEKEPKKGKQDGAIPDLTSIRGEDLKPVIDKQKKIIAEINKLTPPEEQTKEIHKLAVDVMAKMLRATELASQIFSLPEGHRKPAVEEEILELNRQITDDQILFNRKVIMLRQKYNLGKP